MARQEGFEVHEREGVGSGVEDLRFALVLSWCTGVDVDGGGCYGTCEVTVNGPNLIRRPGKGDIVEVWFCVGVVRVDVEVVARMGHRQHLIECDAPATSSVTDPDHMQTHDWNHQHEAITLRLGH
jgi:hypothetical protein